jgi:hypothetical protein
VSLQDMTGHSATHGKERRVPLRHLYIEAISLPRQARDKHRESTQKRTRCCRPRHLRRRGGGRRPLQLQGASRSRRGIVRENGPVGPLSQTENQRYQDRLGTRHTLGGITYIIHKSTARFLRCAAVDNAECEAADVSGSAEQAASRATCEGTAPASGGTCVYSSGCATDSQGTGEHPARGFVFGRHCIAFVVFDLRPGRLPRQARDKDGEIV